MTSETEKAKGKLATLSSSFDDLEALLEPLFTKTLPETILSLEPLQQAKLQTLLPYLVYDLMFIYLKSRGIDPKSHPVVSELDRVKQYFHKISAAENPPSKRTEVDKGAAQRFIKHAITQATSTKAPVDADTRVLPSKNSTPIPVKAKITSKMLERQTYEQKLKEQDVHESEEELQIFNNADEGGEDVDSDVSDTEERRKREDEKVITTVPESSSQSSKKRQRSAIDPFAGYGDDLAPTIASPPGPPGSPSHQRSKPRPKKKQAAENTITELVAGTPRIAATTSNKVSSDTKKANRPKKKSRKSPTS